MCIRDRVTWKTNDGPMHHSGMSHRACSQLTRVLSLDFKNEIIIFTHIGDNWMIESDANGWETYSEPVSYTHLETEKTCGGAAEISRPAGGVRRGAYPADLAGPRHPRPSGAVRVPGGTEGRRRSRQR